MPAFNHGTCVLHLHRLLQNVFKKHIVSHFPLQFLLIECLHESDNLYTRAENVIVYSVTRYPIRLPRALFIGQVSNDYDSTFFLFKQTNTLSWDA